MTKTQFNAALSKLGLNHTTAADVIGCGRATILRYANGSQPVSRTVAKLLRMYLAHGIPQEAA